MTSISPTPPYLAVIFTSQRTSSHSEQYGIMADEMERLASQQDGFLGIESARSPDGLGITVSYWRDEVSENVELLLCCACFMYSSLLM